MNIDYRDSSQARRYFYADSSSYSSCSSPYFFSISTMKRIAGFLSAGVGLQPSELAKLAVIAYLAWFLERRMSAGGNSINDLRHTIVPALAPVLVVVALIAKQPDLGTAIEIFLIALAMLFVAGVSMKYIAGCRRSSSRPTSFILIIFVPWRFERLISFLIPSLIRRAKGFS